MKRLILFLLLLIPLPLHADLRTTLISYWELEEASGTRVDAVTGTAYDLADNNTVTSNTGKVGNAAQFTAASSESLSKASPNTSLNIGTEVDMTLCAWVYLDTKPTTAMNIATKWDAASSQRAYALQWTGTAGTDRFTFIVSAAGSAFSGGIEATAFGAPAVSTWYYVCGQHSATANTVGISVSTGTTLGNFVTGAYSSGIFGTSTATFRIGALGNTAAEFFNGRIDQVGLWKRILTTKEMIQLFNGGAGLSYAGMAALLTQVTIVDSCANTATATSVSCTINSNTGSNLLLVVGVLTNTGVTIGDSAVVHNSDAVTAISATVVNTNGSSQLRTFYRLAPDVGSGLTVTATPSATSNVLLIAYVLSNAAQQIPDGESTYDPESAGTTSTQDVTSAVGNLVIDFFGLGNSSSADEAVVTAGADQTLAENVTITNNFRFFSSWEDGYTTVTMSHAWTAATISRLARAYNIAAYSAPTPSGGIPLLSSKRRRR